MNYRMEMKENSFGVVEGVVLFNTCANCGNKFKPKQSMLHETLCDFDETYLQEFHYLCWSSSLSSCYPHLANAFMFECVIFCTVRMVSKIRGTETNSPIVDIITGMFGT